MGHVGMLAQLDKFLCHLLRPEDKIDVACRDGAAGKIVVLGRLLILCNRDSTFILDSPQPLNTVPGSSGEDDADRSTLLVQRERLHEMINGAMLVVNLDTRGEVENTLGDCHDSVWWNHVDVSRLHPGPVCDLFHSEARRSREKFCQQALVSRVQVLYQNQSHVDV